MIIGKGGEVFLNHVKNFPSSDKKGIFKIGFQKEKYKWRKDSKRRQRKDKEWTKKMKGSFLPLPTWSIPQVTISSSLWITRAHCFFFHILPQFLSGTSFMFLSPLEYKCCIYSINLGVSLPIACDRIPYILLMWNMGRVTGIQ